MNGAPMARRSGRLFTAAEGVLPQFDSGACVLGRFAHVDRCFAARNESRTACAAGPRHLDRGLFGGFGDGLDKTCVAHGVCPVLDLWVGSERPLSNRMALQSGRFLAGPKKF